MNEAFEVIKINVEGKEMVTYKTWSRLLRLAHPGKTKHQIDLLMMVLDTDCTGYISECLNYRVYGLTFTGTEPTYMIY